MNTDHDALRLALPVATVPLNYPVSGLVVTERGELALCNGTNASMIELSESQWSWLADTAALVSHGIRSQCAASMPAYHVLPYVTMQVEAHLPPSAPLAAGLGNVTARAAAGGAELLLYGDVGGEITAKGVSAAMRQIGGTGPITIRINSPGGSVFEAVAIYNLIARHPGRKTVVVEGVAASAASLIAMVGDEIVMASGSYFMVHHPRTESIGIASELRRDADVLQQLADNFIRIYAQRSKQEPDKVRAMMDAETWITAEEAVVLGFANRMEIEPAAIASFDFSKFNNVPPALVARALPAPILMSGHGNITAPLLGAATIAQLQEIVASSNGHLGSDFVVSQLQANATVGLAREAAMTAIAASVPQRGSNHVILGDRAVIDKHAAMTDALSARMGANSGRAKTPDGQAYMGASIVEMMREFLADRGTDARRWPTHKVVDAAMSGSGLHTTSDFPNLLLLSGNRVLAEAYERAASPLRMLLARERTVADFRKLSVLRLGEFPTLERVGEHGEVKYGTTAESAEGYSLETYGKNFGITRQALINDDLGAFAQPAVWAGGAVAETEARVLLTLLTQASGAGPVMSDGKALFHADHANLATAGTAINAVSLSAGRLAMRQMKGTDGVSSVAITPKYLVVGPEKETEAEQMLAALTGENGASNVWAGKLELVVEPRLTGRGWYIFADPASAPVLEVAYLAGSGRAYVPELRPFEESNFLGTKFRLVHDFGAGAVGWRGAWRNPGA